jgi:hypothetical protein
MFTRIIKKLISIIFPESGCKHSKWRPAISNHAPAKWCSLCGIAVNIKEAEFYALFGRSSYTTSEIPRPDIIEHK